MKQYLKFLFTKRLGTAIIVLFMLMLVTVGGPQFDSDGIHWSQPLKEISDPFLLGILVGLIFSTIFALLAHVYDELKKN
jgi:hypothetical protein